MKKSLPPELLPAPFCSDCGAMKSDEYRYVYGYFAGSRVVRCMKCGVVTEYLPLSRLDE